MTPITEATPPTDLSSDRLNRQDRNLILILIAAALVLYIRTAGFDFVQFDDQLYVYSNAYVIKGLSPGSLHWAMTAAPNGNWAPLTTILQLTISTVAGVNHPGAFHFVNVILHAANVALLYLFVRKSTARRWPAFFTALLWGVHPLRVESVAWVSELKDVLCGFFWIAAMLAYLGYARRREARVGIGHLAGAFALVIFFDALALLSKPMAVTLPAALLLLDYWPLSRGRWEPDQTSRLRWWTTRAVEKLPLALLSVGDVFAQSNSLTFNSKALPLAMRLENAIVSYGWYLRDQFFPRHLAILYPHPYVGGHTIPMVAVIGCLALLLVISLLVILWARSQPYLLVGWFWFLGTLVPVMGLVQVGEHARANRFTYLPSIGFTIAVVWLVSDAVRGRRTFLRPAVTAGVLAALALFCVSWTDIAPWKNSDSLFARLYALQPDNYFAVSMKGFQELRQGHLDRALADERQSVALAPTSYNSHAAYGEMLLKTGHLAQAQAQFLAAIKLYPEGAEFWDGLAGVYAGEADLCARHGNPAEPKFRLLAVKNYQRAIDSDPSVVGPREKLAHQLALVPGHLDEAIGMLERIVQASPGDAEAHGDLGDALMQKREVEPAMAQYQAATLAGAKNPAWETRLAFWIATSPTATVDNVRSIIAVATDARDQTHGKDPEALDALAACLARTGQFDNAITAAQAAIAQARLHKDPKLVLDIEHRLALYQRGQAYFR